jgi:hypothetical protein
MDSYPIEILQQRLTAGLGIKGGSRGSLTRCVGRLGLAAAAEEDSSAAAVQALAREIQMAHVELTKLALMATRQRQELAALPAADSLDEEMAAARTHVQELRRTVGQVTRTLASQREYEALAKLAAIRHPTPRCVLQENMTRVQADYEATLAEAATLEAQLAVREKQFASLIQCMTDLKQSLTEPLAVDAVVTSEQESTKADVMEVDDVAAAKEKEDEDEEGALYEDL